MREFTDSQKRLWNISITLGTAKRVKELVGVDIINPGSITDDGTEVIQRLLNDDLFVGQVCAALMDNQKPPLDEFDGATIREMDRAFWQEYRFFFAERGKRYLAKAIEMDLAEKNQKETAAAEAIRSAGATSASSQDEQGSPTLKS